MERFLVKNSSKSTKFNALRLSPDIRNFSKSQEADEIMLEWNLAKYRKNIIRLCDCPRGHLIYLENKYNRKVISMCDQCADCFIIDKNIYENICEIATGILEKNYKKITPGLKRFLNLDKNIVEKYNTKISKRSRKMYEVLSKICEYHYNYPKLIKELDRIFNKISITKDLLIDRIVGRTTNIINNLNLCNECKNFCKCFHCFEESNELDYLIPEQKKSLHQIYSNMFNEFDREKNKFGLFGSAGTGKTTLIRYIIQISDLEELLFLKELFQCLDLAVEEVRKDLNLLREKVKEKVNILCAESGKIIIKKVAEILENKKHIILASPTNKALDVIKEKIIAIKNFRLIDSKNGYYKNLKITFDTISRLLTYHRYYDKDHNLIFKRGYKFTNIIDKYNLIIIDESSMICKENMNDIIDDINNAVDYRGTILFTGDRCQLPPPKEKYSSIFRYLDRGSPLVELEKVVRTSKERINDLSTLVRNWINLHVPQIQKCIMSNACEYVKFYSDEDSFIKEYMKKSDAIILVWTNETRIRYNKRIRKIMFDGTKKEKFMINEHLIFNNFYKLNMNGDERFFYSSMPVIVAGIKINEEYKCYRFNLETILEKISEMAENDNKITELLECIDYTRMKNYIITFVNKFNNSMNNIFKVWELMFSNKGVLQEVPMLVIYDKKKYTKDIENGKKYIREYFDMVHFDEFSVGDMIRNIIIELFAEYYQQPFADIDYGYSMTVDKSQGSTYFSVFIDAADILDRERYPFLDMETAKKRFYTGITRAADEVNILF